MILTKFLFFFTRSLVLTLMILSMLLTLLDISVKRILILYRNLNYNFIAAFILSLTQPIDVFVFRKYGDLTGII